MYFVHNHCVGYADSFILSGLRNTYLNRYFQCTKRPIDLYIADSSYKTTRNDAKLKLMIGTFVVTHTRLEKHVGCTHSSPQKRINFPLTSEVNTQLN